MSRPDNIKYTATHEWVRVEGDIAVVGITDHAVEELSDLAFIDLPEKGSVAEKNVRFGEIESTKAVSDLISPVTGEIVEVNAQLTDHLEMISSSPFDQGWMIRVRMSNPAELDSLLTAEEYEGVLAAEKD
jgi:glycine cleavage system H protein